MLYHTLVRKFVANMPMAFQRWYHSASYYRHFRLPETPLVSICVSAYQRPTELKGVLLSLAAQTYKNLEVIVVHDGPAEWLQECNVTADPRIKILNSEIRQNDFGQSNYETAVRLAQGTYIGLTNDDNYHVPTYVETLLRAIYLHDAQFAYCNLLHNYFEYIPLSTAPIVGRIDATGWIAHHSIVKTTPWRYKGGRVDDGKWVYDIIKKANKTVKVPSVLAVHN